MTFVMGSAVDPDPDWQGNPSAAAAVGSSLPFLTRSESLDAVGGRLGCLGAGRWADLQAGTAAAAYRKRSDPTRCRLGPSSGSGPCRTFVARLAGIRGIGQLRDPWLPSFVVQLALPGNRPFVWTSWVLLDSPLLDFQDPRNRAGWGRVGHRVLPRQVWDHGTGI